MAIVIVGGGITGLAAAEHLTRVRPDQRVILLEGDTRLGGHIRTVREAGFIMEAGPDVVLTAKPAALELARRVGLGDRIQGTNPAVSGSYVLRRGTLSRVPEGMTGLVPSRLTPFLTTKLVSPLGKVRVGAEYFLPGRESPDDESIEHFVVRRLGHQMYDNLVEPLLSGISAGDGRRLSIDAMFPQLRQLERDHGSLVKGVLAARKAQKAKGPGNGKAMSAFASFPTGLQELVDATVRTICSRGENVELRRGARVTRFAVVEHGPYASDMDRGARFALSLSNGDVVLAEALILATPAYVSAALLAESSHDLSARLGSIEYTSTATVSLAYDASAIGRPLDATGYVVPRIEKRPVLACTWTSAKFVGRSPEKKALFRLFIGGVGRGHAETCSDAGLLEIVTEEMRDVMGVTASPELTRITRFDRALPQYNLGHRERIAGIKAAVRRTEGLELAGAVYDGMGIPDCIRSGIGAAERALATLDSHRPALAMAT